MTVKDLKEWLEKAIEYSDILAESDFPYNLDKELYIEMLEYVKNNS